MHAACLRLAAAIVLFARRERVAGDEQGCNVAPDGRKFLTLKEAQPTPGEGRRMMWVRN
jgi:hypothetical protein